MNAPPYPEERGEEVGAQGGRRAVELATLELDGPVLREECVVYARHTAMRPGMGGPRTGAGEDVAAALLENAGSSQATP